MNRQYNNNRSCPGCAANADQIRILENRISFLEKNLPNHTSTPIHRRSRSASRRGKSPHIPRETRPNTSSTWNPDTPKETNSSSSKLPVSTLPVYVPSAQTQQPQAAPLPEQPIPQYVYQPAWTQYGAPPNGGCGGYMYPY